MAWAHADLRSAWRHSSFSFWPSTLVILRKVLDPLTYFPNSNSRRLLISGLLISPDFNPHFHKFLNQITTFRSPCSRHQILFVGIKEMVDRIGTPATVRQPRYKYMRHPLPYVSISASYACGGGQDSLPAAISIAHCLSVGAFHVIFPSRSHDWLCIDPAGAESLDNCRVHLVGGTTTLEKNVSGLHHTFPPLCDKRDARHRIVRRSSRV